MECIKWLTLQLLCCILNGRNGLREDKMYAIHTYQEDNVYMIPSLMIEDTDILVAILTNKGKIKKKLSPKKEYEIKSRKSARFVSLLSNNIMPYKGKLLIKRIEK